MPRVKGQENNRFTDFFADQHGRRYIGNCEIGRPIGPGVPFSTDPIDLVADNWTAPITPEWARGLFVPPLDDHEVVRLLPRHERAKKGYQLHIDYARWLEKIDTRLNAWKEHLHAIARSMTGGINVLEVIENPPIALVEYIGAPPFPPRELIQAMAAGNAWALGEDERIPPKAMELLEKLKPVITHRTKRVNVEELDDPFAEDMAAMKDARLEELMDIEEVEDPLFDGGGKGKAVKRVGALKAK